MANRTDPLAKSVHGTNPQNLVEKIVRAKIYQTQYWKEHCFALTAEAIIDKAVDLKCIGGTYGGSRKPTNFMCLVLKMLQIQPEKEIIIEFIKNEDFKYVRILGAFYMRLVGRPLEVYQYLEPLYNDYRKVRMQAADGSYTLGHVDELIDDMLQKDYMFDIALPRIPSRMMLEKTNALDPRLSVLDEEFDEAILELEAGEAAQKAAELEAVIEQENKARARAESPHADKERQSRGRDRDQERDRDRERHRDRDRDRDHGERDDRDRNQDRDRERARDRERSDRDYDRERERSDRDHHRHDERDRRDRDRRDRERVRDRDRGRDRAEDDYQKANGSSKRRDNAEEMDIAASNALRAKLGLKPLK